MGTTINTLGRLQILRDGQPVPGLTAAKAQALLVYLAVTGRPHSRESLAGLLWGELPDEAARANLRVALSRLRQATGSLLTATWQEVSLNPSEVVRLDAAMLVEAVATADPTVWQKTAALYQGDFLAGFNLPDAPAFEEWVALEREWLRQAVIELLYRLMANAESHQAFQQGIVYARRLIALDNWREEAHRDLMRLLALDGQRSAALAQYQLCRRILAEELGVEPSAETNSLYEIIRQKSIQPHLAATIAAGEGVVAGLSDRPATLPRHNLPAAATSFIGREAELSRLAELLDQADCRLVTILGPGGVGKTRLALQAAAEARQRPGFHDGIFFVPLAGLAIPPTSGNQPSPLLPAIAEALGLTFRERLPPQQQLQNYLRGQAMLLVLDNFDQLVAEGELVAALLGQAPQVKILATSRERLGLYEEWLFDLGGLDYPAGTAAKIEDFSAVQLFTQRARRVFLGFDLPAERDGVIEICRLVEGLPLALEIAAGWVRTIPCRDIARQIAANHELEGTWRNLPDRHRSLQAVVNYSWQLLAERQQHLLSGLAIFRGGFSQDAANYVTGATLRGLSALVDRSLLQRTPAGRYQLHEVVRQFALDRLNHFDWQQLAYNHARYFAAYLGDAEHPAQSRESLDRIAQEVDNVHAAWQWVLDQVAASNRENQSEADWLNILNQILPTLALFLVRRGRFHEAESLFARTAEVLRASGHMETDNSRWALLLARVELQQAKAEEALGGLEQAREILYRVLEVFERFGEPAVAADTWNMVGRVERLLGRSPAARQAYQQALAHYRRLARKEGIAGTLVNLGILAKDSGEYGEATAHYENAQTLFQELNEPSGTLVCLINLGNLANIQHDYGRARDNYEQSYAMAAALGETKQMAISRLNLGEIARLTGDLPAATDYYQESLDLGRESGQKLLIAAAQDGLGQVMLAAGEFGRAQRFLREGLETAIGIQAQGMILTVLASIGQWLVLADPATAGSGYELLDQVLAQPGAPHYVKDEIGRFLAARQHSAGGEQSPAGLEDLIATATMLLKN